MTSFRLSLSCDWVNEIFESVCKNPYVSGIGSKKHNLPAGTENHYPLDERKPAGCTWECGVMLGKQRSECCSGPHLCRSEDHRAGTDFLQDRASQCSVQECSADPGRCLSVWGSKRLVSGSTDCFLLLICSAVSVHSDYLKVDPSLLLPAPWPHLEQFVLTGVGKKSQKQSYPKMVAPIFLLISR